MRETLVGVSKDNVVFGVQAYNREGARFGGGLSEAVSAGCPTGAAPSR
jgi:hypothetical protein